MTIEELLGIAPSLSDDELTGMLEQWLPHTRPPEHDDGQLDLIADSTAERLAMMAAALSGAAAESPPPQPKSEVAQLFNLKPKPKK